MMGQHPSGFARILGGDDINRLEDIEGAQCYIANIAYRCGNQV